MKNILCFICTKLGGFWLCGPLGGVNDEVRFARWFAIGLGWDGNDVELHAGIAGAARQLSSRIIVSQQYKYYGRYWYKYLFFHLKMVTMKNIGEIFSYINNSYQAFKLGSTDSHKSPSPGSQS